jgi:hypothetical protein
MTTFTIDEQNNITAFGSSEAAAAATATPFDSFSSQQDLAELAKAWPTERLVAVWNSLPGVTPVTKFEDRKTAASRVWQRIQGPGEPAKPKEAQPPKPKAERKAKGGARVATGAPAEARATRKATRRRAGHASKAKRAGQQATAPREGSKTAQVVAMLQRKNGATLVEIMKR